MRVMPKSSISASARRNTASMKKTCDTPYAFSMRTKRRAPVIFSATETPLGERTESVGLSYTPHSMGKGALMDKSVQVSQPKNYKLVVEKDVKIPMRDGTLL